MPKKHLHITIDELHEELKKTKPADEHVRGHIERMILEIEMLKAEPGEVPLHRYQQLMERGDIGAAVLKPAGTADPLFLCSKRADVLFLNFAGAML
jgi:hypothetical protein